MLYKGDKINEVQMRLLRGVLQGEMDKSDLFERTSTWSIVTDTPDKKDVVVNEMMVDLSHEEALDFYSEVPDWLHDFIRVKENTRHVLDEDGNRTLAMDITDKFLEDRIYAVAGPKGGSLCGWSTKRGKDSLQALGYDRLALRIFHPPTRENPTRPILRPQVMM